MPKKPKTVFDDFFDRDGRPRDNDYITNLLLRHARAAATPLRASLLLAWALHYAGRAGIEITSQQIANIGGIMPQVYAVRLSDIHTAFKRLSSYASEDDTAFIVHPIGDNWFVVNLHTGDVTRNVSHDVALLLEPFGQTSFYANKKVGDGVYADAIKATTAYWSANFSGELWHHLSDILNLKIKVIETK